MKQKLLVTLIALTSTCHLDAAAGPEPVQAFNQALEIENKIKLFERAQAAFVMNQPEIFKELVKSHPYIVRFAYLNDHLDLLEIILGTSDHPNTYFYAHTILEQGFPLKEHHIKAPLKSVYASICCNHREEVFTERLNFLKKLFQIYHMAPLDHDLKTDKIKTPYEWIQTDVEVFLSSNICSFCDFPWKIHEENHDKNPSYKHRLAKAIQHK